MRFERQARQGVELFRRKCFEVSGIPQRKQRLKEIHRSRGFDADRYQIEKCRQQSKISADRSQQEIGEHTSELQSRLHLVCRLLLEKQKTPPRPPPMPSL